MVDGEEFSLSFQDGWWKLFIKVSKVFTSQSVPEASNKFLLLMTFKSCYKWVEEGLDQPVYLSFFVA